MKNIKYRQLIKIFVLFTILFIPSCNQKNNYITIKNKKLFVEVAYTSKQKQIGLMNRKNLEKNHGMIFVYEKEKVLNFWMKNTYIPLSIAYIREDGTVIGIYDMTPLDETAISSIYPCKYAIEVNQGYYRSIGLKPGDKIQIPDIDKLKKWSE